MASSLEPGRKIWMRYTEEPRLWHARVLLTKATPTSVRKLYGIASWCSSNWWVLTPDGDVYPEPCEANRTDVLAVKWCSDDGAPPRFRVGAGVVPIQAPFVHDFPNGGQLLPLVFQRAKAEAEAAQLRADPPPAAEPGGPAVDSAVPEPDVRVLEPAPAGKYWRIVWSSDSGESMVGETYVPEAGEECLQSDLVEGVAVVVNLEPPALLAVQLTKQGEPAATTDDEAKVNDDVDARILPVKWRTATQRGRRFEEAVMMMTFHDYGDWTVEGEIVLEWLLEEVCKGGQGMVARHHTWVREANIPAGDRSVFEHLVISKVIEVGAELDQLNLPTLLSFELLGRRLQLIEQAHLINPSNPDYSMSDDFMGFSSQRGGALVAPRLTRFAAERAKSRAEIMKEMRKSKEEMRLVRAQRPKGQGKGKKGDGADEAPPEDGGRGVG